MTRPDPNPVANPSGRFWNGKRVLLTGHTGFKGGWLALWLHRLGAQTHGIALPPATRPNLFEAARVAQVLHSQVCDIRDAERLAELTLAAAPEIVFHLAAQPLVLRSYREPLETFSSNVLGTANLLDALRHVDSVRVVVVVTTDKVYRNPETVYPFREQDPLGGKDPYSASKAASEIIVASYRDSFFTGRGVALASARAGNVIGGGDWSEDRILPDAVRAWSSDRPLKVRSPGAVRPWQHVLEPLHGYLRLAEALWRTPALATAYNFGPDPQEAAPVRELVSKARVIYGRGEIQWGSDTPGPHEAGWLSLETALARRTLGLIPRWNLDDALGHTMRWYREQALGANARALCDGDISSFEENSRPQSP